MSVAIDPFDREAPLPTREQNLPENTADNPRASAWVVKNPNVANRSIHSGSNGSHHSTPVSSLPGPHPVEPFYDTNKFQPPEFNQGITIEDEYLQTMFDPLGEKKISKNGYFFNDTDQDRILISTFTLPGRGKKLFCMATDISKELQYRDSYLFLHKNKSLIKYTLIDDEKSFLIGQRILPAVFKSRTIGVITFRSLYLLFGARLLKNGKRLIDDYWESVGKELGFKETDVVHTHSYNDDSLKEAREEKHKKSPMTVAKSLRNVQQFNNESSSGTGNCQVDSLNIAYSNIPVPANVDNHPLLKSMKFRADLNQNYRLSYSQFQNLEQLLLPDPNDEVKQNYLLSSGHTNYPIFSKQSVNFENFLNRQYNAPVTVTSPGGSTPASVTSSLINNDSLISSNGDNIYPVSCLYGQGIAGAINLTKNLVITNYSMENSNKSKLDEVLNSIPIATNKTYINKKSHVGLKFWDKSNVIYKINKLQKHNPGKEELIKEADGSYTLKGTTNSLKVRRTLESEQNGTSVNQLIGKYRGLRKSQWDYYWFSKSGGFKSYKKQLKRKIKFQQQKSVPLREIKVVKDPNGYFDYRIIPKGVKPENQDDNLVDIDLNYDSDAEVVDSREYPMQPNYMISMDDKAKLTQERIILVNEYRDGKVKELREAAKRRVQEEQKEKQSEDALVDELLNDIDSGEEHGEEKLQATDNPNALLKDMKNTGIEINTSSSVQEYKRIEDEILLNENSIDLSQLRFATMVRSKIIKRRRPNPNGLSIEGEVGL